MVGGDKLCPGGWEHGAVLLSPDVSFLSHATWAIPNPQPKPHFPSVSGNMNGLQYSSHAHQR